MAWNWEQNDWPDFRYEKARTEEKEKQFLLHSGKWLGVWSHLDEEDGGRLKIVLLSAEALESSAIEGEFLDRDSVQSSLQKQLGFKTDGRRVLPSEQGIAELMVDVHQNYEDPLTHEKLGRWHEMVTRGRTDLRERGTYRTNPEPMRVVSGPIHNPTIHYEAPPSNRVPREMDLFLKWFESSRKSLPAMARASLAHLRFESIHPFEDGNGRVGRAIAEYALSQSLGAPVLLSLSQCITRNRKRYYDELARASETMDATRWVEYFSDTILETQERGFRLVEFVLAKTRLLNRLRGRLNPRQQKALLRMFAEGIDGFKGGLSSSNYQSITGASPATATRDLADMVAKGALVKTGEHRSTRYWLPL
jgi:Fic family protein